MSATVTVLVVKNGRMLLAYPVCDLAKKFCLIAGTKTLTPSALELIEELGYQVVRVS